MKQLAQTYDSIGNLLSQRVIHSEADYTAHMQRMVEMHGDDVTTVCHDFADPDDLTRLREDIAAAKQRNRELRGEVARLKNLLRAFAVARPDQLTALKAEAKEILK
jgi:hypothetical protein